MPVTTIRVMLTEEAHWAVETDDGRERITYPSKGAAIAAGVSIARGNLSQKAVDGPSTAFCVASIGCQLMAGKSPIESAADLSAMTGYSRPISDDGEVEFECPRQLHERSFVHGTHACSLPKPDIGNCDEVSELTKCCGGCHLAPAKPIPQHLDCLRHGRRRLCSC